jgi:predicted SnoaL-like aldol condensation-catalyzing enzyme
VLIWEREAKDPADPSKMYKYNDFDLFRIANGKIVEHWDGATKTGQGAGNANASTQPHGGSTGKLSKQEKKNEDVATIEMRDILQYGHLELADKAMAPGYIQHNPNVPSGRDGFKTFFARFAKPTELKPEWKRPPVLVLTSGNIVFYLVENTGKDPKDPSQSYKYSWFDMLRVDNGMIQEHWDTAKKNPPRRAGA